MKDGSNKKTDEHAGLKSGNRRPGVEVDLFAANGGVKTQIKMDGLNGGYKRWDG